MTPETQAQIARAIMSGLGSARAPLECYGNSFEFVNRYGLRIDRRPYDWDGYKHLVEPYQDDHPMQVHMAGAQTGKTGRQLAFLTRMMIKHWGALFGYFFPDLHLPGAYSNARFAPFILENEVLKPWLGKNMADGKGLDRTLARTFGSTTVFFLTIGGKTSTEGIPMKGCLFDEVRRMTYHQIQLAEERYSAQSDPIDFKVSTAKYPNSDIDLFFQRGDQRYFHTACGCGEGVVLSLTAPDCILDLRKADTRLMRRVKHAFHEAGRPFLNLVGEDQKKYADSLAAYWCPKCGEILPDPREGWWEPHAPDKWVHSYQHPQMLSPTYPASRVLQKIDRPTEPVSVEEIFNSVFGRAYLDPEKQPVQDEHLAACVDYNLHWPALMSERWRKRYVHNTALGMDAQAGYNCVVIKQMAPNGKHRTIHIEIAHDSTGGMDPWKRVARLMYLFDVRIAVIDCMPHWNEAHRFAMLFKGRVYLANYVDSEGGQMVSWKDTGKKPDQKGEETRFKWSVAIQRTKGLKWSLDRWVKRFNEVPSPTGLLQRLPVKEGKVMLTSGLRVGQWEQVPVCRDVYFPHQKAVAFSDKYEEDEEKKAEGKKKIVAEHVGLDPHFAHANLYADVALARIGRPRLGGER